MCMRLKSGLFIGLRTIYSCLTAMHAVCLAMLLNFKSAGHCGGICVHESHPSSRLVQLSIVVLYTCRSMSSAFKPLWCLEHIFVYILIAQSWIFTIRFGHIIIIVNELLLFYVRHVLRSMLSRAIYYSLCNLFTMNWRQLSMRRTYKPPPSVLSTSPNRGYVMD